MKKSTINFLVFILVATVTLSSCGSLKKMAQNADLINYTITPDPLEMHAGKVPLKVDVTFPAKYFNKKAYLVITPYLVSDLDGTQEIQFRTQTLQGEKVKDNNPVIPYATGGSYSYTDTIDYADIYRMSDLELRINANLGGSSVPLDFATIKIADGIITTPELVDEGLKVDNGTVGTGAGSARTVTTSVALPASSTAKEEVKLYYDLQKSNLSYKEMKKAEIDSFINEIKALTENSDIELTNISIASYASPDGPTDLNADLVDGRGTTSEKYLVDKFKKAKVEKATESDFLKTETTPEEDWEGFKSEVTASELADKELILRVLSMYSDPEVREKEIKNMSKAYLELADDVLPLLRRSEISATYKTKPKTKEQLIQLGKTNPEELSQVELFYGAQEAPTADKETIYKAYTSTYASDWKGFNNLGVHYITQNKLSDAEAALNKANSLEANNATIMNNLGALYWAKGDMTKAKEYFDKAYAKDKSDEIGYNLGVILIKEAKYSDAVQKFGSTASFNKSLAQLLNDKTAEAASTLKAVTSEEAIYYYLKAVIAANEDKENDVLDNLKKAVGKDAKLKDYAKNDMEFNKYFENETFKAIVE